MHPQLFYQTWGCFVVPEWEPIGLYPAQGQRSDRLQHEGLAMFDGLCAVGDDAL